MEMREKEENEEKSLTNKNKTPKKALNSSAFRTAYYAIGRCYWKNKNALAVKSGTKRENMERNA